MNIKIPDAVAGGIVAALENDNRPDVRHLVRELRNHVASRQDVVSADEWESVIAAIDTALVSGLSRSASRPGDFERLRAVRPKLQKLLARQQLRTVK